MFGFVPISHLRLAQGHEIRTTKEPGREEGTHACSLVGRFTHSEKAGGVFPIGIIIKTLKIYNLRQPCDLRIQRETPFEISLLDVLGHISRYSRHPLGTQKLNLRRVTG